MGSLQEVNNKISTWEQIQHTCDMLRTQKQKIVFTNGCFDIIHKGHIIYLSQASDLGDILVVGINSDASVRRLKGEDRPIQEQDARLQLMASLFFVDHVVLFEEDTPQKLIEIVRPDYLVKGGDYKKTENIVGYDFVTAYGGEVKTLSFTDGYSTSSVIEKIR